MPTQTFRGSVGVTVFRDSKLLCVTNRKWGGFSCPGGKIEEGEDLLAAAKRELREETGCEARSIRMIAGYVHRKNPRDADSTPWFCTLFLADIGDQTPQTMEEGTTPFWTTKEDLTANSMFPELYIWLFDLLKRTGDMPQGV